MSGPAARFFAWAGLAAGLAVAAGGAPRAEALGPCPDAGLPAGARCATVSVPVDRDDPAKGAIALDIVRLPATEPAGAVEPLFIIAPGPGVPVAGQAAGAAERFAAVAQGRDLVLVERRGTGGSRFDCPLYPTVEAMFGDLFPVAVVEMCRATAGLDPAHYGLAALVEDLESARAALGVERMSLWAEGLGARLALAYARAHPDRVRAIGLRGPVPIDVNLPLWLASAGQKAFDRLFVRCQRDAACRAGFPDLKRMLTSTLRALAEAPATATITDPDAGETDVVVTRDAFVTGLQAMTWHPVSFAEAPSVIAAAASGDFGPAASVILAMRRGFDGLALGAYLSELCAEDGPALVGVDPAQATRLTYVGDAWASAYQQACAAWPVPALAEDLAAPVESDTPTLVLSGEFDAGAPPDLGEHALATLAHGTHVVFKGPVQGTPEAEACVDAILAAFYDAGTADGLDATCAASVPVPGFVVPEPAEESAEP
ncbi:MAG: alpha/beta fold hydrolase [Alphaproteobacteria bacterium]